MCHLAKWRIYVEIIIFPGQEYPEKKCQDTKAASSVLLAWGAVNALKGLGRLGVWRCIFGEIQ